MAEIQITTVANANNGSFNFVLPQNGGTAITLTGQGFTSGLQSIGFAAEEDLDYGDVSAANAGILFMRNIDATNYVQWGLNDSGSIKVVGRLKPNAEFFTVIRVEPSAQIMLQANTGACLVEFYLLRD